MPTKRFSGSLKKCLQCLLIKPIDEFYSNGASGNKRPDCKECNKQKVREYELKKPDRKKKYREKMKEFERNRRYCRAYKLTSKQVEAMFEKQQNRCAICNKHKIELKRPMHIDHNHLTGVIRGILCFHCNSALGKLKGDNGPELLIKAIKYISN